jgi:hypothetical protein
VVATTLGRAVPAAWPTATIPAHPITMNTIAIKAGIWRFNDLVARWFNDLAIALFNNQARGNFMNQS